MKTHQLQEARAAFSRLVDDALKGEPQRVTRRGREAVVIVSEAEWEKRAARPAAAKPASFSEMLSNLDALPDAARFDDEEWRDIILAVRDAGKFDPAAVFGEDE